MKTKTVKGTYGSNLTPCDVFVCGPWYVCEGSVNINCAADEEELNDDTHRLNVEYVNDVDCMTASEPINSEEELQNCVEGNE
jgi:hypothetical protein